MMITPQPGVLISASHTIASLTTAASGKVNDRKPIENTARRMGRVLHKLATLPPASPFRINSFWVVIIARPGSDGRRWQCPARWRGWGFIVDRGGGVSIAGG